MTGGVTTAIRHYSFSGLRIAVKRGSDLYHLHGDHLGSTSLTTDGAGAATASRAFYAYGAERCSPRNLKTDRTFTGQKADATGPMFYNARYYAPALGAFISPDSVVPNAGQMIHYNRFLYARGNPLKYIGPTGYAAARAIREWAYKNRWYNARGWFWDGGHWGNRGRPRHTPQGIRQDFLDEGIEIGQGWNPENSASHFDDLKLLRLGVSKLAAKAGGFDVVRDAIGEDVKVT